MKYRIYNILTGTPISGTKVKKYVDPNMEVKQIMRKRYTYTQMNGGRPEGWGAVKDLMDHARRKMPASMLR